MTPVDRRRGLTAFLSVTGHAAVIWVLASAAPQPPPPQALPPITVVLTPMWRPVPPPVATPAPARSAPAKARPAPAKPAPSRAVVRPRPAPPDVPTVVAGAPGSGDTAGEIGDGSLTGAAGAGSGEGQGCNMPGRLQRALRKDRLVQAAVAKVDRGRALSVWDGDWVRHAGQEGAGLAAVREAILWEVAFAPEACRTEPMRGLIVLTLAEGPGAARLVVGARAWRWKDVLASRSGRAMAR